MALNLLTKIANVFTDYKTFGKTSQTSVSLG